MPLLSGQFVFTTTARRVLRAVAYADAPDVGQPGRTRSSAGGATDPAMPADPAGQRLVAELSLAA